MIIGLISILIGTDETDRVEAAYRQRWKRGLQITSSSTLAKNLYPHGISMFHGLSGEASSLR